MKTLILATFALLGTAVLAADPPKLPDLESKEWKEHKEHKGLKLWDVKAGDGAEVKAEAKVKVHYTGWLKTGKVFDSSKTEGQPITFGLNQVIKGWGVGLVGMKVGGTRRLYIPSEMAYGKRDVGDGLIPANSDLIFEVELLDIK
jgi:peptidylprolyl isomerase